MSSDVAEEETKFFVAEEPHDVLHEHGGDAEVDRRVRARRHALPHLQDMGEDREGSETASLVVCLEVGQCGCAWRAWRGEGRGEEVLKRGGNAERGRVGGGEA